MRRVLVVTGFWPPHGGPGTLRTYKSCQMLPELGWAPTVITPRPSSIRSQAGLNLPVRPPGVEVKTTDFDDRLEQLRRWLGRKTGADGEGTSPDSAPRDAFPAPRYKQWARELAAFPDAHVGWVPHAVEAGLRAIADGVDVVWTTSPPETAHVVGRILERRTRIPWVAELRDPWSDYHHIHRGALLRTLHRWKEKQTLRTADVLVTLSPSWREHFAKKLRKRVALVRSGFDPADLPPKVRATSEPADGFRFVYTGKLHPAAQNPSPFFEALSSLRGHRLFSSVRVEFFFYGDGQAELRAMVSRFGLEDVVRFRDPVTYRESLRLQSEATVLLLFDWRGAGPIERGVIPLKAYEYMATHRPVLVLLSKDGDLSELARTTPSFHGARTAAEATDVIGKWLDLYEKAGRLPVNRGNERPPLEFTRRRAAEQLAQVFEDVLAGAPTPKETLEYA